MRTKPLVTVLLGGLLVVALAGCKGHDDDHFVPPVTGTFSTEVQVSPPYTKDESGNLVPTTEP